MVTRMPEGLPTGDSAFDDNVGDEIPKNVSPMAELGVTGVKRVSGYLDEEFLPALRGRKAVRVYREMMDNDSMVGALLFTIDKLVREVEWHVVPADQSAENVAAKEFLESCMDDMSHSWDDFMGEVLSMIVYGWSWHEVVFKKRVGPWEKDGSKRSKYTDGLIGIRKIPIRAQETMLRWSFDEKGGVQAMVQMAPPYYQTVVIPVEKSLLFRTSIAKGNPEGKSLLRTAYRSWFLKKRIEEFEAIGVERDLAGMPVAKVPADYLMAQRGTKQWETVEAFRKMVRGVRRDENEGLVLPVAYDRDTKQPLYDFELLSSSGSRQFDTNAIIQRYEQRILMSVLADFILIGHQDVGSYSLHTDKTGIFRAALNAITKSIADTLNRHLVPKLFAANGWKLDELPQFQPADIDPPDLTQLSQFITATAGAGMQWFPDPELEKFLRDIARLPELTEDTMDYKREMQQQQQAMEYAQSSMGLMGAAQQQEMVHGGLSPEQAQIQAQNPTDEQIQQQTQQQVYQQDAMNQVQPAQQLDPNAGPNDKYADNQHKRDKESADRQEKQSAAQHKRDTERMRLQDQMDERKHKRSVEQLRMKAQAAKTAAAKKTAAKPPAKKAVAPKKTVAKKVAAKKATKK